MDVAGLVRRVNDLEEKIKRFEQWDSGNFAFHWWDLVLNTGWVQDTSGQRPQVSYEGKICFFCGRVRATASITPGAWIFQFPVQLHNPPDFSLTFTGVARPMHVFVDSGGLGVRTVYLTSMGNGQWSAYNFTPVNGTIVDLSMSYFITRPRRTYTP